MSSIDDAASEVELGLPLGRSVHLRLLRRLFVKLLWPVLGHQVALNRVLRSELASAKAEIAELARRADRVDGDLSHHSSVLSRHEENAGELAGLRTHARSTEEHLLGLQAHADRTSELIELAQRQAFARHQAGMGTIRSELSEIMLRIDGLFELRHEIADLRIRLSAADLFVQELKRSLPELPTAAQIAQLPSAFDELYSAFEDAFRGSERVIDDRVRVYLADLPRVGGPIVDIGSGRGEWLEVLKENGIESYGIEINGQYVARCVQKGLDVRLGDAIAHLKSVPEGTLRAVSAIQVVEHLDVDQIIELIDRAVAALRPGGVLIFETPNPDNLTVGASSFYIDPTHRHPLPAALLEFLVASRGMIDVETRFFNRAAFDEIRMPIQSNPWSPDIAPVINALNSRLYNAQDYAVIAFRP